MMPNTVFGRQMFGPGEETDYLVGDHCEGCTWLTFDGKQCVGHTWAPVPRAFCYPLERLQAARDGQGRP